MKTLILFALVGVAFCIPTSEWELYKLTFKKAYSVEEDAMRREIFEEKVAKIQAHNKLFNQGVKKFHMAVNKFSDWTKEEVSRRNGFKSEKKQWGQQESFAHIDEKALPKTVDWRKKGIVTGVKDQGQCGSCWAFAAVGSLEGQHALATKKLVSLSEQNLVDCSQQEGNMGCEGGLPDYAYQYIIDNKGIDTEASYPYTAEDDDCNYKKSGLGATIKSFTDITSGSEKALQKAVATIGPISVGIDASSDEFQSYSGGIYDVDDCSTTQLDHGVTVVGYGTQNGTDYWLVKNSWGTDWGIKGYILMSRNKNNQCGIATLASYPNV